MENKGWHTSSVGDAPDFCQGHNAILLQKKQNSIMQCQQKDKRNKWQKKIQ